MTTSPEEPEEPPLERIAAAQAKALAGVGSVATLDDLAEFEAQAIGKRSVLLDVRKGLGKLDAEERKTVGQAVNDSQGVLSAAIEGRRAELAAFERRLQLEAERLDLTEIVGRSTLGHAHLVSQAWERLEDVFLGMGFTVSEGPEVETEWLNFGALNFPEGHPARDGFDTLWVDWGKPGATCLRTHTSPVQMRAMMADRPPIYTICPGRVFRQDTPDATHMPVFHQIEGLVIDRGISFGDLAGTLESFTKAYFGFDFTSRLRPSYFPFTEPSAEFDIRRPDGSWMELGGCGMVHPNVLRAGGIDPEEWSGFAFGFGLDRFALSRHGVDDLREFFSGDIRFLSQF